MVRQYSALALLFALGCQGPPGHTPDPPAKTVKVPPGTVGKEVPPISMRRITGEEWDLSEIRGKVMLFVNVASRCGYTNQYEGLQELHERYGERGLVLVGVPANDFGFQEPGTNAEILTFCRNHYQVTFPLLAKVHVRGEAICPLYKALISPQVTPFAPGPVKWNFEKFLIGRDGRVLGRFRSRTGPTDEILVKAIEKALG